MGFISNIDNTGLIRSRLLYLYPDAFQRVFERTIGPLSKLRAETLPVVEFKEALRLELLHILSFMFPSRNYGNHTPYYVLYFAMYDFIIDRDEKIGRYV